MKRGIQGLKIERAAPADLESAYKVFEESIAAAFAQEGISQDAPAEIEYKKQLIRSSVHEDASAFIFLWPRWAARWWAPSPTAPAAMTSAGA